jgi:predicted small lipoprotein YifL
MWSRFVICFHHSFHAAICLAALLSLQGCGRRGPLEPPPGASPATAPQAKVDESGLPQNSEIAPIDAASTPSGPVAATAGGQGRPTSQAPPAKAPPRPFVLDPLI